MPAPEDATLYADDPEHPLPFLSNLDFIGKLRTGGAELVMMIFDPLAADERSQRRLLRKFDNYLGFIASPDYLSEFGVPDPSNTRVVVQIDERSDPIVFELLRRCEPWVRECRATLAVETTPARSA